MNSNSSETAQQEDIMLLNRFTKMLEEQINIIQSSNISGGKFEAFAERIQPFVDEIACKGLLDMEKFRQQREYIKRLYDNLNIAIIANKNETGKYLNHIRKGKKTLVKYRNTI